MTFSHHSHGSVVIIKVLKKICNHKCQGFFGVFCNHIMTIIAVESIIFVPNFFKDYNELTTVTATVIQNLIDNKVIQVKIRLN